MTILGNNKNYSLNAIEFNENDLLHSTELFGTLPTSIIASHSSGFVHPCSGSHIPMPTYTKLRNMPENTNQIKDDKNSLIKEFFKAIIPVVSLISALLGIQIVINNEPKDIPENKKESKSKHKTKPRKINSQIYKHQDIFDNYFTPKTGNNIDMQRLFSEANKLSEEEFHQLVNKVKGFDPQLASKLRCKRSKGIL